MGRHNEKGRLAALSAIKLPKIKMHNSIDENLSIDKGQLTPVYDNHAKIDSSDPTRADLISSL